MPASIDVEEQDSLSYTRGFGTFHFAPVDDEGHDVHRRNRTTWKAAAAAAAPPLKPTTIPSTFPFMKLPIEIRKKIYACFVDELRDNVKGSAPARRVVSTDSGPPAKYTGPSLHLYVFDKTFDPDYQDDNGPVEPMLVEGAPDARNVDPRTGQPLNVLEMYKAIREGRLDSDEEKALPENWRRLKEDDHQWSSEEDASMSDAGDEESEWDSDEAEIAVDLKRKSPSAQVVNIEDDDSEVEEVKPSVSKKKAAVTKPTKKAPSKPAKQEVMVIDSSDESEEEEYVPSSSSPSSSSSSSSSSSEEDSSEGSDKDEDADIDSTRLPNDDFPDSDNDDADPTYHDSDYDREYIAKANKLAAKRNRALLIWTPRCYVAIYSRTLTSPDCPVHNRPSNLFHTLDFEDLWACATCSHRNPAAYHNLRRLAQVNPFITTELGTTLWHGSTVEFDGPETFLSLATERPAILPLIRNVVLNLEIHPILPFGKSGTKNLADVIEIISERMDLDSFKVQLGTPGTFYADERPEPEWGSEWRREWAPLVRGLKTRRLELGVVEGLKVGGGEGVKVEEDVEAVLDGWMGKLLGEWTPDCLRREEEREASREIKREETEEPVKSLKMVLRLRS
ncbi:hypothetical protein B0T14DRAFT_495569 [Immersiella caudata]|uniref:Uncharacterized protein n=1 Tax=Immersiella caudata TaxID=314043 RepID=A0AA40C4P9_9PEZI|nr:hypothetical protein B0T14DRAFT_495569 [Immersiella caudata]